MATTLNDGQRKKIAVGLWAVTTGIGGLVFLSLVIAGAFYAKGPNHTFPRYFASIFWVTYVALPAALILASIPTYVDRYRPEPFALRMAVMAWGASFISGFSFLVDKIVLGLGAFAGNEAAAGDFNMVLVEPLMEESLKGMLVIAVAFLFAKRFDGMVDGIVYGVMVGIGVSLMENIHYYVASVTSGAVAHLTDVFGAHAMISPWWQPIWGGIIGLSIGYALETPSPVKKIVAPIAGWFCAFLLHALWGWLSLKSNSTLFYLSLPFWIATVVGFYKVCTKVAKRESDSLRENLMREVAAGNIDEKAALMVTHWDGRELSKIMGVGSTGVHLFKAATDLAYFRWQMHRAEQDPGDLEGEEAKEFEDLQTALQRAKNGFRTITHKTSVHQVYSPPSGALGGHYERSS